jgi:hypothetical protein
MLEIVPPAYHCGVERRQWLRGPSGGDPHRGLKRESRKFCGAPSFYAPRLSKLRYGIETTVRMPASYSSQPADVAKDSLPIHHAGQIGTVGSFRIPRAQRKMRHVNERLRLDVACDLLPSAYIGCV